jgi:ADP-ribose pyrophosphatase YjhB (NUDIX family)
VKAVIIDNGQILMNRCRDAQGIFYMLPGGGQDHGETLPDALRRECLEEIGAAVEIGELLCVRDYIGRNHEFAMTDSHSHQVEVMFACRLLPGEVPCVGHVPDTGQIGVEWVPFAEIDNHRIYPRSLMVHLSSSLSDIPRYIGDVN